MDFGLIFRSGKPLDRKHYLVASVIAYIAMTAIGLIVLTGFGRVLDWVALLAVVLAVIAVVYLFLFRIRRVKDIGFSSWFGAFAAMVMYAALAYVAGFIHPVVQTFIVAAFELVLLLVPTGANYRKVA
ncbi:hypothetical protein I6F07_21215 [Ensifer sp. IC4062]|nr:hypothetical protein [Ensifer sp. IC4062]MCA1442694.1 hypothetical protein [Ensifer sp. IC4062]